MTLAFSEQINNQPSYFPEKIWDGLLDKKLAHGIDYVEYDEAYKKQFKRTWDIPETGSIKPKLHTIREDASNRWRAGMDIHMVINNRTKNRFQFAPVVKCVSVQEIEITDITHISYPNDFSTKIHLTVSKDGWTETFTQAFSVKVDGTQLSQDKVHQLALNDGFDSVEDFFAYFNKDFKGKVIHWTDVKY